MKRLKTILGIFVFILLLSALLPTAFVYATPNFSISPLTVVSGTIVTIKGLSFGSYSGDLVSVYLDDKAIVLSSVTISASGVLQTTLKIPEYTKPGVHTIGIISQAGVTLSENQFIVPPTEIVLNKWGGTVGTTIEAFCKGFYAGQEVKIQYYATDTRQDVTTGIANEVGECTMEFPIPVSATGLHKIIADNESGDYAETNFEIIPSLTITPSSGTVGDKIVVSGAGFIGNSEVSVNLNGEKVAYAQVYERGNFDAIFLVPTIKAGTYALEIEDSSHTKRWIDFTVESRISISKTTGEIGTTLTLNGTGFEGGFPIIIKYDANVISSVNADDSGSFSFTFNVPVSVSGAHFITVTDGFNTNQTTFSVESTPPDIPNTIIPKTGSMVGAKVSFDWESIYDPSEPVLYTLQIAKDDSFFNPILVKDGLSASQYTLTPDEALLPNRRFTHYYWRVRATDSASNQGDWSDPIEFQVGPVHILPQWARYALSATGVVMIILLLYLITKGTAKPKVTKTT